MERNLISNEVENLKSPGKFSWIRSILLHETPELSGDFEKAKAVDQIQKLLTTELQKWNRKKETDSSMYTHVKQYWKEGVGLSEMEAGKIIEERKSDLAAQKKDIRHPWSAAFISFIMRKVYPNFKKSRAHNRYIQWAKENRDTNTHPFQAFRVEDAVIEPGDIICFARSKKNWASYDNVEGKLTHGDIVREIRDGRIVVAGGNVNRSVRETSRCRVSENGKIIQEYTEVNKKMLPKYIAVIKITERK